MIELSGVTKSFGSHQVLKGITGSVQRGEVVCLIGEERPAALPRSPVETDLRCNPFCAMPPSSCRCCCRG